MSESAVVPERSTARLPAGRQGTPAAPPPALPYFIFTNLIFHKPVYATCPVCIVAVGGGLWLAEILGVDDLIAAIWIGALVTALAVFTADKIRRFKLPSARVSWTLIYYFLTLSFLQIDGKLNSPYCRIWGVCKLWLGITLGMIALWIGVLADQLVRKKYGKALFPFQKVVLPIVSVIIFSVVLYLLTCA